MGISDDLAFAKMLGAIYTEVFQRSQSNPNKPLNVSAHSPWDQVILDDVKSLLSTSTNVYVWGPSGTSDEVNATPSSARWGMTGVWG